MDCGTPRDGIALVGTGDPAMQPRFPVLVLNPQLSPSPMPIWDTFLCGWLGKCGVLHLRSPAGPAAIINTVRR